MNGRNSWPEAVKATAVLAGPFAAALVIALVFDRDSWLLSVALFAVASFVAGFTVYRHFDRLAGLRAEIDRLAADEEPRDVARTVDAGAVADLAQSIRRTGRLWSARRTEAKNQLAADEIIIDKLPDPMVLLDEQARIVRVNAAARELLGHALKGRDLSAALRHPRVLDMIDQALADGGEHETEFVLPDFVDRSFNARAKPLAERSADGSALILTLHDLTEVKRGERMQADFVANASHELRTPLSALVGFIETLRGPAAHDSEARQDFLRIMHEQAQRMARLIQDLLSLSRIEMDEHTRPTGRVAVAGVLKRVARSVDLKAKERGVEIQLDIAEGLPPAIGDADQLEQVFQNLVDNAVKYGRENAVVTVSAHRAASGLGALNRRLGDETVLAVSVHDEGGEIAPEHLPRLTERFYRVDTARSRELGGTGLGLAIVKHIVNRHRGALSIESAPGRGTRFTVHLPAAR